MGDRDDGFAKGFLAGWALGALQGVRSIFRGRFWRRRSGISPVLAIFGALGLISACMTAAIGVPLGLARAREVRRLPRPSAEALKTLPPGSELLISGQLVGDGTGPHGLALYYVEMRQTPGDGTPTPSASDSAQAWTTVTRPQSRLALSMESGGQVVVQLGATTSFLNAERFEEPAIGNLERRTSGYLPGQILVAEGTWEGGDLVTAPALFGGSVDAYVSHISRQPGRMLAFGGICGGFSVIMLAAAVLLRILGR